MRAHVTEGSYVLILDGVDEIPVPHRKVVANWVAQAHKQNACVLVSSRIVGYEDGPVDRALPDLTGASKQLQADLDLARTLGQGNWSGALDLEAGKLNAKQMEFLSQTPIRWAQLRYLMPFDQKRIAAFADNWYRQRCGTEQEARQKASDLLISLAQSDVTRQLARTPNLLSLMAIVHRERAHLPDGKALLYDEIANAYINTIDKQRKIEPGDILARYGWKERKSWLAYVGFQMQQLRGRSQVEREETDAGVLADEVDVLNWMTLAMQASGVDNPQQSAQTFLGWVARRSGLLLPRGDKRYAFVHLSFQEYFCACYLDARIASRAFIHDKLKEDDPVTKAKLATWSRYTAWRETLVYLFELQSAEREADWVEDLAEVLFKPIDDITHLYRSQAALASRVLADRHIRLGEDWKNRLAERCCEQARKDWRSIKYNDELIVLPTLLSTGYAAIVTAPPRKNHETTETRPLGQEITNFEEISSKAKLRICIVTNRHINNFAPLAEFNNLSYLVLSDTNISNVAPLTKLYNLQYLYLDGTDVTSVLPLVELKKLELLDLNGTGVADVTPLAGLNNLNLLNLENTQVADVTPLAKLNNLLSLDLSSTRVTDISPLAGLHKLRELELNNTQVENFAPLAELNNLRELCLRNNQVRDITPLVGLNNLHALFLNDTPVDNISQLARLINLDWLVLNDTKVVDIRPLAKLNKLRGVFLGGTLVADFTPLAGLNKLKTLNLQCPKAADVTPLAGLSNLEWLNLEDTQVANVTPLAGLKNLDWLSLENTQVADVTPLARLNNLRSLDLSNTHVTAVAPLAGLNNLERLVLKDTQVTDIKALAGLNNLQIERDTSIKKKPGPLGKKRKSPSK